MPQLFFIPFGTTPLKTASEAGAGAVPKGPYIRHIGFMNKITTTLSSGQTTQIKVVYHEKL
jgi:hypothetical protein